MPKLRRLGNMAQFFLQSHLKDVADQENDARTLSNQSQIAQLQDALRRSEAGYTNQLELGRSMEPKITSGDITPGQVPQKIAQGLGGQDAVLQMAPQNDIRKPIEELMKARELNQVPSMESMVSNVASKGRGWTNLGNLPQLDQARKAAISGINQSNEAEVNQAGATAQNQAYSSAMGTEQAAKENDPAITARKITDTNLTEQGTRKERIATAGSIAGAQAGAAAAFQKPDILYGQNGDATAIKFNPDGSVKQIALPPGLSKTGPKDLAVSEVDQLSGIGTAEVEGVKILQQLHKSGLDKSNNPTDPRWEKFVVGTLKMAPTDWNKADIQQRTAFVQAALTRSLMGARPSQYVAQMIQQHMPQGEMTGAQLNHVLNNVLQQGTERRKELANYSGKTIPEPTSGTNYSQWQQFESQNPNQELPPGVSDILSRPARTK